MEGTGKVHRRLQDHSTTFHPGGIVLRRVQLPVPVDQSGFLMAVEGVSVDVAENVELGWGNDS
jgi:hypothetical protein|tara:strand:- start:551 stop:739 length:189 start_codon:yes stop_codon:yes gene_type:complete